VIFQFGIPFSVVSDIFEEAAILPNGIVSILGLPVPLPSYLAIS
jgi:hypothetical protein